MPQTPFTSLPEQWQSWITENLARSCDPASLTEQMGVRYPCRIQRAAHGAFEVQPQKGGAVFFLNTDSGLVSDRRTLHAGSPVVKRVKFVANKWLREREYR